MDVIKLNVVLYVTVDGFFNFFVLINRATAISPFDGWCVIKQALAMRFIRVA